MVEDLCDNMRANRSGKAVDIPSACSAHPKVLRESLALAALLDRHVFIEARSHRGNQDAGSTGTKPVNCISFVHDLAGTLQTAIVKLMLADPAFWTSHCCGEAGRFEQRCHFGIADPNQYDWPHTQTQVSVENLLAALAPPISDGALAPYFIAEAA